MAAEFEKTSTEYDVVIIGGGISGLYSAWRLANSTNLKVLVLEGSNRFGGRLKTCEMPGGYQADMGAMRYNPKCHPILHELITKLGVKPNTENLTENSPKANSFKHFVKNKRISTVEEFRSLFAITDNDLHLFKIANRIDFCLENPEEFQMEKPEDGNYANSIFPATGQKAKDMSLSQYLLQTKNGELANFSWFCFPPSDWQLAIVDANISLLPKYSQGMTTVEGGFETIVTALLSHMTKYQHIETRLGEKVSTVTEKDGGFAIQTGSKNYSSKHVIYACSKIGLSSIELRSKTRKLEKIRELTNKVKMKPGFKLYLTYKRPWWEDYGLYQGVVTTDLPIHLVITCNSNAQQDGYVTLLAAYPNHFIEFFQGLDLPTHERFINTAGDICEELKPSKLLVENVHDQLKTVFGCPDLDEAPVCAARQFWGDEATAGVLCYPNIGVDSNKLHWDSLKPFEDVNMYITGDTFPAWTEDGVYIGFTEGPLLTSERILVNHFGIQPFTAGLCLQNPWP